MPGPRAGAGSATPDYFDRYFALGVPQDDVPDELVRQALLGIVRDRSAPSRHEFESVVPGDDENLALRALLKRRRVSRRCRRRR